jgi:hypothetical protein
MTPGERRSELVNEEEAVAYEVVVAAEEGPASGDAEYSRVCSAIGGSESGVKV